MLNYINYYDMNRTIMLTLCITALLYSCTATKSSSDFSNEIFVDVEQSVELPLQRGRIIPLETSDSSLLYDIVSIDQVKDKYFIRSRNKILTFDTEGNYLYNISGNTFAAPYIHPALKLLFLLTAPYQA